MSVEDALQSVYNPHVLAVYSCRRVVCAFRQLPASRFDLMDNNRRRDVQPLLATSRLSLISRLEA